MLNGADPDKIDQALVVFGMPMGPIELCDQVGIDVCLGAGKVTGISPQVAARFTAMSEAGNLGRKSGSGFYEWDGKKGCAPGRPLIRTSWMQSLPTCLRRLWPSVTTPLPRVLSTAPT